MNLGTFLTISLLFWGGTAHAQVQCPLPTTVNGVRTLRFPDGSIAMSTRLAVNPDGTPGSYTVGDHGFTYIANGLALYRNGARQECKNQFAVCREAFLKAEAQAFGPGTEEFCVFAMEVEAPPGKELSRCLRGYVVGNGKGQLRIGGKLKTVTGGETQFYASTTALMHTMNGKAQFLDSAIVPSVVIPITSASGLGQVVWVRASRYPTNEVFSVAGDTGPAFGEGSIALHQLLRYGRLIPQNVGPIAKESRCKEGEIDLLPPFQSRPDIPGDKCTGSQPSRGASDIRAYTGIENGVDFVLLGNARFEMKGNVVKNMLDVASIRQKAEESGYTQPMIRAMAACLNLN